MNEPNWSICGVGGRVPACENCGAHPAAMHVSGISVLCKFLLCRVCYDDLAKELAETQKVPA